MPSKRKLEKRKRREKVGREKAKVMRAELVKRKAAENAERKRLKRIEKLQKELLAMDQPAETEKLLALNDASINQLEKNIEILKGLEQEFADEQKQREQLNEELEDQGFVTLEDKLKATQQIAAKKQQGAEVGVGGSAQCSMKVNVSEES